MRPRLPAKTFHGDRTGNLGLGGLPFDLAAEAAVLRTAGDGGQAGIGLAVIRRVA
jgi:hypothetical protein